MQKHDTFFQCRKGEGFSPILLKVLDVLEEHEGGRCICKVRWHVLDKDKVHPSEFQMVTDNDGIFYEFRPIPRELYKQAVAILKKDIPYRLARRQILDMMEGQNAEATPALKPSREQFHAFIDSVRKAQEKEDNVNKAFDLIWDDDQGQHTPFYISAFWEPVYLAFNIMFGLEDDDIIGNELSWWLEEAPDNNAKYWIGEKEYNISDVDAFYDYLLEMNKG